MRVLVTGATGHLGSFVARAMLERGHEVRALVRDPARLALVGLDGVDGLEAVRGDVGDPLSVRAAMVDMDGVVHAAAQVALRKKDEAAARAVNVGGTARVLDEAAAVGLDPVVHVSSLVALFPPTGPMISADDAPTHPVQPYSASKADAHRLAVAAQERGQPVTIFTLGGVWGPGTGAAVLTEQLAAAVALLKVGVPVSKTGGMPVLDVRDAAEAIAACLEQGKGPRRFILGGHFVPTAELADRISEASGRRLRRYRVPARVVVGSGAACDLLMKVLPVTLPVTREGMAFLVGNVPADNQPTVDALGVALRPAQETLDDTYEWLVHHGHVEQRRVPRFAEVREPGAAGDRAPGGSAPDDAEVREPGAASDRAPGGSAPDDAEVRESGAASDKDGSS